MSTVRQPSLNDKGEGYLVVLDNGSGNFIPLQVTDAESPVEAIKEALPHLEGHASGCSTVMITAYPDTN